MEDRAEVIRPVGSQYRVAVISDTHIPDRVDSLHPALKEQLKALQTEMIFHCGDIAVRSVLGELREIAPVRAVTGNRDILLTNELPVSHEMTIYDSKVVITHGHLNPGVYWKDKLAYLAQGYNFERYKSRLCAAFPEARVIIFGHTHRPENEWSEDKLIFNPGSVSHGDPWMKEPYYGFLIFHEDGRIDSRLIPLTGAAIKNQRWVISS